MFGGWRFLRDDSEIREFRVLATSSTPEGVEDAAKTRKSQITGSLLTFQNYGRAYKVPISATFSVCRNKHSMTARTLCFTDYDAIGFDVDHTLAKYNIPHLFNVVHDGLVKWLVEQRDWDTALLQPFSYHQDFCTRGLVADIKQGNILKLAGDGYVIRASHGTRSLTDEEICAKYGESRHWAPTDSFTKHVDNIGDGEYMIFENFYDSIGILAYAQMIDIADKRVQKVGGEINNYRYIWEDLIASLNDMYRYQAYEEDIGGFFPPFKQDPGKFLVPLEDTCKSWLRQLRSDGRILFVMTSSYIDFAKATLNYILGSDWHTYFDVLLTRARKPSFFYRDTSFQRIDISGGKISLSPVDHLEDGGTYSQGNLPVFHQYIKDRTQKEDPKVLFCGDSMRSDIFPSKYYAKWDTIMLVEEMASEIVPESSAKTVTSANNNCDVETKANSDTPPVKRKRKVESRSQEECQYLTSQRWGSFFTDSVPTSNSSSSSQHELNTLWGTLIWKYADLAIPTLDYVTDLPVDHKFEVFNHAACNTTGFYPDVPDALK